MKFIVGLEERIFLRNIGVIPFFLNLFVPLVLGFKLLPSFRHVVVL